jgi:hypothetical protein
MGENDFAKRYENFVLLVCEFVGRGNVLEMPRAQILARRDQRGRPRRVYHIEYARVLGLDTGRKRHAQIASVDDDKFGRDSRDGDKQAEEPDVNNGGELVGEVIFDRARFEERHVADAEAEVLAIAELDDGANGAGAEGVVRRFRRAEAMRRDLREHFERYAFASEKVVGQIGLLRKVSRRRSLRLDNLQFSCLIERSETLTCKPSDGP